MRIEGVGVGRAAWLRLPEAQAKVSGPPNKFGRWPEMAGGKRLRGTQTHTHMAPLYSLLYSLQETVVPFQFAVG